MNVLTTWQSPREASGEAGNAVSLRVSLRASRVVIPTRWINGNVSENLSSIDSFVYRLVTTRYDYSSRSPSYFSIREPLHKNSVLFLEIVSL
jgi:hypothetical protein